jgi:hypothetical protein
VAKTTLSAARRPSAAGAAAARSRTHRRARVVATTADPSGEVARSRRTTSTTASARRGRRQVLQPILERRRAPARRCIVEVELAIVGGRGRLGFAALALPLDQLLADTLGREHASCAHQAVAVALDQPIDVGRVDNVTVRELEDLSSHAFAIDVAGHEPSLFGPALEGQDLVVDPHRKGGRSMAREEPAGKRTGERALQ